MFVEMYKIVILKVIL